MFHLTILEDFVRISKQIDHYIVFQVSSVKVIIQRLLILHLNTMRCLECLDINIQNNRNEFFKRLIS